MTISKLYIHSTGVFLIVGSSALDFGKLASTAVRARVRAWSHEVLVLALHNFRLTVPRRIPLRRMHIAIELPVVLAKPVAPGGFNRPHHVH